MRKAKNLKITQEFLDYRSNKAIQSGYQKQKWVMFCEYYLQKQFDIYLYEAKETVSKYVTLKKNGVECTVRFSNHRPSYKREMNGDCDFFVGVTHTGVRTARDAAIFVNRYFASIQYRVNT